MVCRYASRADPCTLAVIVCPSGEREIGPTRPAAQYARPASKAFWPTSPAISSNDTAGTCPLPRSGPAGRALIELVTSPRLRKLTSTMKLAGHGATNHWPALNLLAPDDGQGIFAIHNCSERYPEGKMKAGSIVVACLIATMGASVAARAATEPGLEFYEIGDFPLESGEIISDFSIAYMTQGTLNAKKSNAVLMVTAISGNHHRIDFMIGPGKGLDTDHLFVVKTNAIGNGLTTSPSNSATQHGPAFPHFTIRDMVQSQYQLLQHLGIDHLVAVAGASMGGMQTLQWGVSHPEMMDSLIALTPMARTSPWSIAVNEATRHALMFDPAFNGGNYSAQPENGWRMRADVLQVIATRTPEAMRRQFPNPMDVLITHKPQPISGADRASAWFGRRPM